MMTIMRMRCAILTIAYFIPSIFPAQTIIFALGKVYILSRSICTSSKKINGSYAP